MIADPRITQIQRVYECMSDGFWYTLDEIADVTDAPVTSISAQLRNLRKPRYGRHTVERRVRWGTQSEYRLVAHH